MAQRFELELVTIFTEQGLGAAVQRLQQQLRSISVPTVSGGGAANVGRGGPGLRGDDAVRQINQTRLAVERAIRQLGLGGTEAAQALRSAEADATRKIIASTEGLADAIARAQRESANRLISSREARSVVASEPPQRQRERGVGRVDRLDATALASEVEDRYQRLLTTAARDTAVNQQILQSDEAMLALARRKLTADERNAVLRERANAIAVQQNQGAQVLGGGTAFQRAQALISARQTGGVVDPSRFQTAGQFVASRAFTTAGFALSGAALYGGVNALKSTVEETEKLDVQFRLLQQQMEATGQAGEFKEFRRAMIDIARQTGIVQSDVVNIGYQLRGAFDDTTEAIDNTASAMKLVRISGLAVDEVTNDMTATAATFGVTFEQIGNSVVSLERRYGVLTAQSLNTFGQMSNSARQAGLTFEQTAEIIGAVGRVAGRSSGAIAESFNRILPSIQSNATEIQSIYTNALDAGAIPQKSYDKLLDALAQGQTGQALLQVLRDYDKFSRAQQNQLVYTLGGARESQTVTPLIQQRQQILAGIQRGPEADVGALEKRFGAAGQSLDVTLDRIARRFQQFGVQLGEAGVLDGLKLLGAGIIGVLDAANILLRVFEEVDDLFGGIPHTIVGVVIAIKLLQVAINGLGQLRGSFGRVFDTGALTKARTDVAAEAAATAANRGGLSLSGLLGGGAARQSTATQGVLFNESTVRRSLRDRLTTTLGNAISGATQATQRAVGGAQSAYRTPGVIAQQQRLPGFTQFASTATSMNTGVSIAGRGFVTSVTTGLRGLGARLQGQLISLGNLNAGLAGGARGTGPGRVSQFITGGGGLQGGITTAFTGIMAAAAVGQLVQTFKDQQSQLSQQTTGLRQQLGTKSLDQLLRLQQRGTFNDNWATRAGSWIGLNATVGETASQAIGSATQREFEKAIESGILARNKERDRLLEEVKKSRGMGKAGERARRELASLPVEDRKKIAEFAQSVGEAQQATETQGAASLADIESLQQQFELGRISYSQYVEKLQKNVENLRRAAAGGSPEAIANLQKGLQQFIQTMGQLSQVQDQFFQQGLEARNLTAQQQSAALRERVAAGIPNEFRELSVPTPTLGAVDTPRPKGPTYDDNLTKRQRLDQINALVQRNRELFDQAAQNVNDPALLEQLRRVFSLSPEQLAEYQSLQFDLANAIGDTGEIQIQARHLEQARDRAFQLAQTRAQATIAGLSDPGAIARIEQQLAGQQLANAQLVEDPGQRELAVAQAQLSQAQARRQAQDAADAAAMARLQAQGARVAQDPVAAAQNAIAQANLATRQARGNQAALAAAQGQLASAQQQLRQAQQQVEQSQINLFKAQHPEDAIAQAQAAQREADLAARNAQSEAGRLDALAQRVAADRQMQDALREVADAQSELLQAQFTAAGELVLAAQEGLKRSQRALDVARARGAGREVIDRLEADVVTERDRVRRQQLQDSEELINFDLEMGNITRQQAIAQYELLLAVANPDERRKLLLEIKQLRDAASSSDLQFNLPTELGLPTLYSARRLVQQETSAGFGAGYQAAMVDNRVISITLNANNAIEGRAALQFITDALDRAPTIGMYPRKY